MFRRKYIENCNESRLQERKAKFIHTRPCPNRLVCRSEENELKHVLQSQFFSFNLSFALTRLAKVDQAVYEVEVAVCEKNRMKMVVVIMLKNNFLVIGQRQVLL